MSTPPPGQWPPPPPPQGPSSGSPSWGQQAPGPSRGGNGGKWLLGGLALLVVVVVSVVATLLVTRQGAGATDPPTASAPPSTTADASDVASANDRDPAGIILDDPTCESWMPIAASFSHAASNGWDSRDPSIPAAQWSINQRNQYEAVAAALLDGADRSVELAENTPHRVMHELYSQFIAYGRDYAEEVATYEAKTDALVRVVISASSTISAICDAISYGSAGARSPLVASAAPTPDLRVIVNPAEAERFLVTSNPVCSEWASAISKFDAAISDWKMINPNLPATEFSPEQRNINASVQPIMTAFSTDIQQIGLKSDNAVLSDFATLSAQYLRAYVSALQTYAPADNFLQLAASAASAMVTGACSAVGA